MNPQKPSLMQNMNMSRKKTFARQSPKGLLDLANKTRKPQMLPIPEKVPLSEVSTLSSHEVSDQIAASDRVPPEVFKPFFMSQKEGIDGSIYYDGGHIRLIYEDGGPQVYEYDSLYFSFHSEEDAKEARHWVNDNIIAKKKIELKDFESEFQAKPGFIKIPKENLKMQYQGLFLN